MSPCDCLKQQKKNCQSGKAQKHEMKNEEEKNCPVAVQMSTSATVRQLGMSRRPVRSPGKKGRYSWHCARYAHITFRCSSPSLTLRQWVRSCLKFFFTWDLAWLLTSVKIDLRMNENWADILQTPWPAKTGFHLFPIEGSIYEAVMPSALQYSCDS